MANTQIDNLALGNLLQIVFSNGVRNQISENYREFEEVMRYKVSREAARELRFMIQTNFGPSAIQYVKPGTSGRSFPAAQQASITEGTAKFKEINATIELEYNLWDRARTSPSKYGEPLALEINSKAIAAKRRIAADFYADGSGTIGEIAASGWTDNGAAETITAQLATANGSKGHVGYFEFGDFYKMRELDDTAPTTTSSNDTGVDDLRLKCVGKDRENNQVTFELYDESDLSTRIDVGTLTQNSASEVFYRIGQTELPDLTSSITDWGTETEVMVGLDSLTENDSRVVHGITLDGANAGSRVDAGGAVIDSSWVQKCLDKTKVNVGPDAYRWKKMCMSPESHAALIDSREADRRFHTVEDNKRGTRYFAYQHGNDSLEAMTGEFCPRNRIYMLPESKGGDKVLEYYGSDFEPVRGGGLSEYHLKPGSAGGYQNVITSFLQAVGLLVCKHPASIGVIENFVEA